MNIDRKLAGLRVRAWLLVVNFCFNAIAIYGLSRVVLGIDGWAVLSIGGLGTLGCLLLLSKPSE